MICFFNFLKKNIDIFRKKNIDKNKKNNFFGIFSNKEILLFINNGCRKKKCKCYKEINCDFLIIFKSFLWLGYVYIFLNLFLKYV